MSPYQYHKATLHCQVSNLQKNKDGSWHRIDQEYSREDGNQDGNYHDGKVDGHLDFAELLLHLGGRYETQQDRAGDGDTAAMYTNYTFPLFAGRMDYHHTNTNENKF